MDKESNESHDEQKTTSGSTFIVIVLLLILIVGFACFYFFRDTGNDKRAEKSRSKVADIEKKPIVASSNDVLIRGCGKNSIIENNNQGRIEIRAVRISKNGCEVTQWFHQFDEGEVKLMNLDGSFGLYIYEGFGMGGQRLVGWLQPCQSEK